MEASEYFPFIVASILLFNVIGHFGNINIIILYLKRPNLRTHYGCLLVILSACQSICLLFEFMNIYFAINGYILNHVIHRDDCFRALFPYVFFNAFQADVVAAISIDFLLCLCFPLKYRTLKRSYYLPILLAFPFFHGFYLVIFGFFYLDNAPIRLCNPPSALCPQVNRVNYIVCLASGTVTLAAYSLGFVTLYLKTRTHNRVNVERKALRSISLLVIVYLCNRFLAMLLVNLLNFLGASRDAIILTQDLLVISALICFSQNFYVCYFRSHEYRHMLNTQLACFVRVIRPDYSPSLTVLGPIRSMTEGNREQFRVKSQSNLPVNATVTPNNS